MSKFIPNTHLNPSAYIDEYLHLLSGEEWKVLSYAVRRTMGFQRGENTISLTQFETGIVIDGIQRDHGTGLSRSTVIKCLQVLTSVRLLDETAPNDRRVNKGAMYALQLDSESVDTAWLQARYDTAVATNQKRTAKARQSATSRRSQSVGQTTPDRSVSQTSTQSVGQTEASLSDRPQGVGATDRDPSVGQTTVLNRYPEDIQEDIQREYTPPLPDAESIDPSWPLSPISEAATPAPAAEPECKMYDLDGGDDPRYHTEHFIALAEACDIDAVLLKEVPRERVNLAGFAESLKKRDYTPEDIGRVRETWHHRTAPTPQQVMKTILAVKNQKEAPAYAKSNGRTLPAAEFKPGVHVAGAEAVTAPAIQNQGGDRHRDAATTAARAPGARRNDFRPSGAGAGPPGVRGGAAARH